MKKLFIIGIVTLFVGMTIYPCINAGFLKIETRKINDSICDATSWRYLPFIRITNDKQFEFLKKLGLITGEGTTENPYIIEGFNLWGNPLARWISVLHNTGETLIYISDTEKHVIIRNNYIHHSRLVGIAIINADNVVIENNVIKHNVIGIALGDSNVRIQHNDISVNRERGIYMYSYKPCNPIIEYNIISSNGYRPRMWWMQSVYGDGLMCHSLVQPEIHHNNIFNNEFGLHFYLNEGDKYFINATSNWWGSADGPSGAGPGSGDGVTSSVNYEPWLTEPEPDAGPQ